MLAGSPETPPDVGITPHIALYNTRYVGISHFLRSTTVNRTHETLETSLIAVEPSAPEIVAFCSLLARIMYRCLTERNPRIMALLDLPIVQGSEVAHEQAA